MPVIEHWQARRARVEETADAILAVLREHAGEWVAVWPTLCDAQLRDENGLVDVALVESIGAIQRRGVTVERRDRRYTVEPPPAYRVVREQRAGCRVSLVSSRMCERGTKGCEVAHADPASVLAVLLAESPEATVAAIEALLTSDEAVDALIWESPYGLQRHTARRMQVRACRSLLSKAPKEDGDA